MHRGLVSRSQVLLSSLQAAAEMAQSQSQSQSANNSSDSALGNSMRTPGQSQSTWSLASAAGDRDSDTPRSSQRVDLYVYSYLSTHTRLYSITRMRTVTVAAVCSRVSVFPYDYLRHAMQNALSALLAMQAHSDFHAQES